MDEIVKATRRRIGDFDVLSVNARGIHAYLNIARDYNQWMREQIERARLVQDRDYLFYEDVETPTGGRPRKEYVVTIEAGKHIAMMSGSDKGFEVRDYFIECERRALKNATQVSAPVSVEEMLLAQCHSLVDHRRRIDQNEHAINRIEHRVDEIEQGQILIARPANSEPITHIRKRIAAEYGLSAKVIDEVMRQSPYALKPAATVRNSREEAQGAVYTVWWIKDVTATFKRFVAESVKVSEAQYTHPYLSGRFRMNAPP
ncbi:antA/AntB antirepressor family protein [Robbsia andropogonis]|uniref:antA/AntB antirepressor family protein n=1 Tax=Robbsia andropogonis TaxID=28092 RepID=UPI003D2530B9